MNSYAVEWLKLLQKEASFFNENLGKCREVQLDVLLENLAYNKNTEYGKKYDFGSINSYESFREKVPLITYDDLETFIEKIKFGNPHILTKDQVVRFEKTSGSTGTNKLIPYTESLINDFQKGVAAWMHSILKSKQESFDSRFYLALSPKLMNSDEESSAVQIGAGGDLAYFDRQTALALYPCIAIPDTSVCKSDEDFYRVTIASLLKENLSLISCWSPTYLLQIDALMRSRHKEFNLAKNFVWKDVWPGLALVSCWTDASAALFIPELQARLGEGVEIEGKGLMSTECICSIPYGFKHETVLSYTSHFYEFENERGDILLSHELETGKEYSVIVTTSGGLYRYKTDDCIKINGFYESLPIFKFMGREGRVSDMVGEKLSEAQVNEALENLSLPPSVLVAQRDHYELISEQKIDYATCMKLDCLLSRNCYYEQARKLGQLNRLSSRGENKNILNDIQQSLSTEKIQDTTVKFHSLILYSEWQHYLSKEAH